jgi:hypothetical protein
VPVARGWSEEGTLASCSATAATPPTGQGELEGSATSRGVAAADRSRRPGARRPPRRRRRPRRAVLPAGLWRHRAGQANFGEEVACALPIRRRA